MTIAGNSIRPQPRITTSTTKTSQITPKTRKEWRAWLKKHHASSSGVWLRYAKKHTRLPCPTYDDTVEEALCFGWIDGLVHPVDGDFYRRRFTPRKPRSTWAATNKARVAQLINDGLMTPAGLAAIAVATKNGSWSSLDSAMAMEVPPDLRRALNANPLAKRHWRTFTDSQRRMFLFRLSAAKRAETRARRVREIVSHAERRITPGKAYEARRAKASREPGPSRGRRQRE